jgi:hypothetical protein
MNGRFTLEDLVALLERLCPTSVVELHDSYAHVVCGGVDYDAYVTGTDIGRRAISLACELGPVGVIEDRVSLAKILENLAGCAAVRLVVVGDRLAFETCVTPDDLSPDRLDAVVRWHLTELTAVAGAWRRRLGVAPDAPAPRDVKTLDELVRTTPVPPQKALLVAMVGFAVAGADGRISAREVSRLQSWFKEVPSFMALDQRRQRAEVRAGPGRQVDEPNRARPARSQRVREFGRQRTIAGLGIQGLAPGEPVGVESAHPLTRALHRASKAWIQRPMACGQSGSAAPARAAPAASSPRSARSAISRRKASRSAVTSPGATSRPADSGTVSGSAPVRVAITGRPWASASA